MKHIRFAVFLFAAPVYAAMVPNRHYLTDAKPDSKGQDFVVEWLERHGKEYTPEQLAKKADIEKTFETEDEFAKALLELEYATGRSNQEINAQVLLFARKAVYQNHPLAPYFVAHALKRDLLGSPEQKVLKDQVLASAYDITYPDYLYISKRLTDPNFIRSNIDTSKKLLGYLVQMHHDRSVDEVANVFLRYLSKTHRDKFNREFELLATRRPAIVERFPWLKSHLKMAAAAPGRYAGFSAFMSRGDCNAAKATLQNYLKQPGGDLYDQVDLLKELKDCSRFRGSKAQIALLSEFTPLFDKAFGLEGAAAVDHVLANVYWNSDFNKEAISLIEKRLSDTEMVKYRKVRSQLLYLLARIYDNEQNFDAASKNYQQFVSDYPEHEMVFEAQKWLALAYVRLKDWPQTYQTCRKLIDSQGELPPDLLDLSLIGFSLFWGGRAALETDRKSEGLELWNRLASEYFSTYYGALAHYALEEISQKEMILASNNPIHFNQEFIEGAFANNQKPQIARIQTLLRLGLRRYAQYEINNVKLDDLNPNQVFIKALLLHGSGAWLESIKEYSKLPYSYRTSLPIEAERILYPKKFEDSITEYSKKAKLDPFLILSLIRQESVFNPRAVSGAGARGLMQLMEKTALDEASKLPKDYVSGAMKTKVVRSIHNFKTLHETDVNILLGVHYFKRLSEKYNNPALSLAAYNAGPSAVTRWQQKYPTSDILYFVEKIPYKETRNYVKLILRNYFYYKRWYNAEIDTMNAIKLDPIGESLSHLRIAGSGTGPISQR